MLKLFKHHRLIEAIESDLRTSYQQYYRLAFRYVANEADALDIVQESAYKAIQNVDKLDDLTMVHPWIYRIVINTSISFLRKQKKVEECLPLLISWLCIMASSGGIRLLYQAIIMQG